MLLTCSKNPTDMTDSSPAESWGASVEVCLSSKGFHGRVTTIGLGIYCTGVAKSGFGGEQIDSNHRLM
jgi:hypothetical protein